MPAYYAASTGSSSASSNRSSLDDLVRSKDNPGRVVVISNQTSPKSKSKDKATVIHYDSSGRQEPVRSKDSDSNYWR